MSKRPSNRSSTAGLVLGIIAIFVNTFFFVSVLGLIFSLMGIRRSNKMLERYGHPIGRSAAVWGLVLNILAIINSIAWKWAFLFLV